MPKSFLDTVQASRTAVNFGTTQFAADKRMQTIQDFGKGHLISAENDHEIDSLVDAEK